VVNLHLQSLNTSWDAYPDNHHHLDAISFDKVQQSIEVLKNRNFTINESPLAFLRKYDLIREDKNPPMQPTCCLNKMTLSQLP